MNGTAIGRYAVNSILVLGLVVNGCKSAPKPATPAKGPVQGTLNPDGTFTANAVQPGQQGTLNSDGTFTANGAAPGSATQPVTPPANSASSSVPAAGSGAPMPASSPAAPEYRTVPAGTSIAVTITESLSASHNNVGDGFSGVLAETISVGGKPAFARGTRVQGTVVAAKGKGRFKGAGALGIELTSIGGERVSTSEYEKESKGRGKRSAGFIGGGAGLGAIIGGIAGGGEGRCDWGAGGGRRGDGGRSLFWGPGRRDSIREYGEVPAQFRNSGEVGFVFD